MGMGMREKYILGSGSRVIGMRYDCVSRELKLGGNRINIEWMEEVLAEVFKLSDIGDWTIQGNKAVKILRPSLNDVQWQNGIKYMRRHGWELIPVRSFRRLMH